MKSLLLTGIIGIGLCSPFTSVFAAKTIQVSSYGDGTPSLANTQAAYNAAATGDTILFPLNGNAVWSTTLTVGKAITIDGNGTTLKAGSTLANGFFYVTGFTSSSLMRITGFTFNLVNLTGRGLVVLDNDITLTQLRIDHNTFHHGEIQMEIGGSVGTIDHNYFYNGSSAIYPTAGTRAQADASWASMAAGTSEALFIEDNHFIINTSFLGANENNSCIDTYNGGKMVIRYNVFDATNPPSTMTGPFGAILTHGSAAAGATKGYWQAASGARRGQSVVEIYNNTFSAKRIDFLAQLRGSANLVHDNTLNTTMYNPRVIMYEEEQWVTQWNPMRTSWPAEDQVHNSFFWNNTLNLKGTPNTNYVEVESGSAAYIKLNRDYFLHAPQASGGYEYFTGANGASSSFPTDGIMYPTRGTMAFSSSGPNAYYGYAPYTYPHPLTSGTSATILPPSNVVVSQ